MHFFCVLKKLHGAYNTKRLFFVIPNIKHGMTVLCRPRAPDRLESVICGYFVLIHSPRQKGLPFLYALVRPAHLSTRAGSDEFHGFKCWFDNRVN